MTPESEAMFMRRYTAYGLTIESTIDLPELMPLPDTEATTPDVWIRYGPVPENLETPVSRGVVYQACPKQFLLRLEGIARYLVLDGREIYVAPADGSQDDDVRLFLLGSVLAALLHQRGMLVLHGSAIVTESGVVVFVGPSGVGKSTLAAALGQRGYRIMADDVCALQIDAQGIPLVYPSFPQLKLWVDMLDQLGQTDRMLRRVRMNLEKYALPLNGTFYATPCPLHMVYHLTTHNKTDIQLEQITQMNKFRVLLYNTYRQRFMYGLGMQAAHFRQAATVANQVSIKRITRPIGGVFLEELLDLLIADFCHLE